MKLPISRLLLASSIAICILFTAPAALQAAPVGTFTIDGNFAEVRVGASFIDWGQTGNIFEAASYPGCIPGPNTAACPITAAAPTYGDIQINSATGSFTGVQFSAGHMIRDLEDDFALAGTPNLGVQNFLILTDPSFSFVLDELPLGTGEVSLTCMGLSGNTCTPPGSPFTITNGAGGGSSVTFEALGTVTDATGSSKFKMTFVTPFANQNAAQLIQEILSNGFIQTSSAGSFITISVPEPSSIALIGGGALMLLLSRLRRRKLS